MTLELDKLEYDPRAGDLNVNSKMPRDRDDRGRGRDRDRGGRRERGEGGGFKSRDKGDFHRFFINMGKIDHMNKGALLRMVCEVTGLEGKDIGGIRLFDRHSTFEVNNRLSSGVEQSFRDV